MPTGWRIVKTRFVQQAFDGEGARLYGGRWNSPGVKMIYTSESLALAALEILAHLGQSSTLASYSRCAVHFDDALVRSCQPTGACIQPRQNFSSSETGGLLPRLRLFWRCRAYWSRLREIT